jgi:hypothetical protein
VAIARVKYHSGPVTTYDTTQRSNPMLEHAVLYVAVGANPTLRAVELTEDELLNIIEQAASALSKLRKRNGTTR